MCKGLNVNCDLDRQDVFCPADWEFLTCFCSKALAQTRPFVEIKVKGQETSNGIGNVLENVLGAYKRTCKVSWIFYC